MLIWVTLSFVTLDVHVFLQIGEFSALVSLNRLSKLSLPPFIQELPKLKHWFNCWYPKYPKHYFSSLLFLFPFNVSLIYSRIFVFKIRYIFILFDVVNVKSSRCIFDLKYWIILFQYVCLVLFQYLRNFKIHVIYWFYLIINCSIITVSFAFF